MILENQNLWKKILITIETKKINKIYDDVKHVYNLVVADASS